MNQTDLVWLENRIQAAVDDDFYLDRGEEKRIKEETAAKGVPIKDTELVIRTELEKAGAVCERILLVELDRLMRQFTDNDKRLDSKEERDALDKVLIPAPGKKVGLDPTVAKDFVDSFCVANGVRRDTETKKWAVPMVVFSLIITLGIGGFWISRGGKTVSVIETKVETKVIDSTAVILTDKDKAEIDDQLRRANQFVEKAQYTDPPERSAKACLDAIRQIDPKGTYHGDVVRAISTKIVDHYLALADKSNAIKDSTATIRWLERAKLLGADTELIIEKERMFGLIKPER